LVSDWSSDVCSSDLLQAGAGRGGDFVGPGDAGAGEREVIDAAF